jgi:hypothetical protein
MRKEVEPTDFHKFLGIRTLPRERSIGTIVAPPFFSLDNIVMEH